MQYECEMVADLLPLYKDEVCSPASRRAVEEHLAECPKCRDILEKLNDVSIDDEIIRTRDEVIESQSRFFKRKSALMGSIIAAVFAVPVLICLIVNLMNGNGLGWFFTAASSVLFGLTICFAPFIVSREPVNKYLEGKKGLAVMGAYTITFVVMILCIGFSNHIPGFFRTAFGISGPIIAVGWLLFAIIRYLPANGLIKAGASIGVLSVFVYFAADLIGTLIMNNASGMYVYVEPSLPMLLAGLAAGAALAIAGFITNRKGGTDNEEV